MNEAKEVPEWAPDDCPPDVTELINIENQLSALGLRGLASADSKTLRAGFRKLTRLLNSNYKRGERIGRLVGLVLGAIVGGVLGATMMALLR